MGKGEGGSGDPVVVEVTAPTIEVRPPSPPKEGEQDTRKSTGGAGTGTGSQSKSKSAENISGSVDHGDRRLLDKPENTKKESLQPDFNTFLSELTFRYLSFYFYSSYN
jgi:hypothetical protein